MCLGKKRALDKIGWIGRGGWMTVSRFPLVLDPKSRTQGGFDMGRQITREVLESYLHCKTKAHLKLAGQRGSVSDYEALLAENRREVRRKAIGKILERHPESELARGIPLTADALRAGPSFVLDATLEDDTWAL